MNETAEYFAKVEEQTAELQNFKRAVQNGERIEDDEFAEAYRLFLDVEDAYDTFEAHFNFNAFLNDVEYHFTKAPRPTVDPTVDEVVAEATGDIRRTLDADDVAYLGLPADAIGGEVL